MGKVLLKYFFFCLLWAVLLAIPTMGIVLSTDPKPLTALSVCAALNAVAGFFFGMLGVGLNDVSTKRAKEYIPTYFTENKVMATKMNLLLLPFLVIPIVLMSFFFYYFPDTDLDDLNIFWILLLMSDMAAYWLFAVIGGMVGCLSGRCEKCKCLFSSIPYKETNVQTEKWKEEKSKVGRDSGYVYERHEREVEKESYIRHCKCVFCGRTYQKKVSGMKKSEWTDTTKK